MSVVCKFYLRGNCRRGNACRFDHVLPDEDYGSDGSDVRGTSVLKRDNSSYDSGSGYSENSYYEENKSSVYKKYNDRNVQGQYVTINNDYYGSTPIKQYDQRNQYQNPSQRFSNDRFHYDSRQTRSNAPQQQHNQYQPPQDSKKSSEISVDEMYVLLKSDIATIENSHIWPLTSFCTVKLFGSLDDWFDYSPEEMRLAAYLAKATNNFVGYTAVLDKVVSHAQSVRNFYTNMSRETSIKIKEYVKQKPTTIYPLLNNELDFSCIDCSVINLPSSSSNEIGSVVPSENIIEQQHSDDTEMAQSAPKSDIFVTQSTSSVDFGSVQESKPTSNIFGGFSQESKSHTNVFGSSQTQDKPSFNVFGFPSSNVTSNNFNQLASNNTFDFPGSSHQTSNIFGAPITQNGSEDSKTPRDLKKIYPNLNQTDLDLEILSLVWHGDSPYSRKEELTEEEYEQFKAPQFTLGKLPMVPPPREFC